MNFLKYIDVKDEEISTADETRGEVIENRQREGIDYFKKWDKVNDTKNIRLKEKERSDKYNGKIFIERGYNGKDIGMIKKKFEDYICSEMNIEMNEFIDSNEREKIIEIVEKFLIF
jgi:ribosomal protein L19